MEVTPWGEDTKPNTSKQNNMKKLSIMLMLGLCLGFTSCEDEWTEALPQSNPQESLMSADGLTLSKLLPEAIDLNTYTEGAIPTLKLDSVKNLPAGSEVRFEMQMSKTEDFAKVETVATTLTDSVVYVTPDAWEAAHLKVIGKSPKEKQAYVRYAAYVVKGTSEARLGGLDTYYAAQPVKVTPYPSDLVIEENYYLLGTINGWSVATAIKLNHTGDPYDNPVFTVKVDISKDAAAGGWWWKIVPESTFKTGNWVDGDNAAYGVTENGDESLSGMLVARTATSDVGAGCLKTDGQLLLTINMEDGTYAFTSAVDYLYTPGPANGWSPSTSMKLRTSNYADYEGYAIATGGMIKFTNAPDWDHINYGYLSDGKLTTDPTAGNIPTTKDGLYYCNVSTAGMTYSITYISTIGLIGDATPGAWATSTPLTPSADFKIWTGEVTLGATGEFKFRANDGWDVNLGGALNDLVQGGANIATPGAGTYKITLDLSTIPYTATVVKK